MKKSDKNIWEKNDEQKWSEVCSVVVLPMLPPTPQNERKQNSY